MRMRVVVTLVVVGFFLAACAPKEAAALVAVTTTDARPMVTATFALPAVTDLPAPTRTSAPTATGLAPSSTVSITPKPALQLCSPLAEQSLVELAEIVTDPYHPPPAGKDERHHGTDFAYYRRKDRTTIAGEVVQAILPGKVVAVVNDRLPYGNMVIIETARDDLSPALNEAFEIAPGEALYHLYAHFGQSPRVTLGQQVRCGEALGEVGATGYNIVNPHLHLETRVGPAGADFSQGLAYYSTAASETERSNYELWRTSGVFRHFDPMALIDWYLQSR